MKVGEVGEAVATDIVGVFRWIERHYKDNRGPAEKGQITKQSKLDQVPDTRPLGPREGARVERRAMESTGGARSVDIPRSTDREVAQDKKARKRALVLPNAFHAHKKVCTP